jgi:hypothetical protein
LSHANVRSTTQRRGSTSKPSAVSDRLMISMVHLFPHSPQSLPELVASIAAVCEYVPQPREAPYDIAQHHWRTVPVLNVSRVDHGLHQISFGVGQDMAFAALDLLASVPRVWLRQPEDRLSRKDRRFPCF